MLNLLRYDTISIKITLYIWNFQLFYNVFRSNERELGRSSGWMFLDAANDLFVKARLRVYGTNMTATSKLDLNNRAIYSQPGFFYFL
jgi:hypothetical protein